MKIKVREAHSTYKVMKVGPIKAIVEDPFKSFDGSGLFIKIEIPLKNKGGDPWDTDTSIRLFDLESNRLETILKRMYRKLVGTALFNADYEEILKDKYDFSTFAEWEEGLLADKAGIDALKAEAKKRLNSFKPEEKK